MFKKSGETIHLGRPGGCGKTSNRTDSGRLLKAGLGEKPRSADIHRVESKKLEGKSSTKANGKETKAKNKPTAASRVTKTSQRVPRGIAHSLRSRYQNTQMLKDANVENRPAKVDQQKLDEKIGHQLKKPAKKQNTSSGYFYIEDVGNSPQKSTKNPGPKVPFSAAEVIADSPSVFQRDQSEIVNQLCDLFENREGSNAIIQRTAIGQKRKRDSTDSYLETGKKAKSDGERDEQEESTDNDGSEKSCDTHSSARGTPATTGWRTINWVLGPGHTPAPFDSTTGMTVIGGEILAETIRHQLVHDESPDISSSRPISFGDLIENLMHSSPLL